MALSKKYYETIAADLRRAREDWEGDRGAICALDDLSEALAQSFSTDNPRFDYDRFMAAARGAVPAWSDS